MKLKGKLVATIMAMCMVITLGVIGIFAVKKLEMSVGGNITFKAEGLDFVVSNGSLKTTGGADYTGANSDTDKLKGFTMNTNIKESDIATEKASWTGLNLTMSDLGNMVLTFTIENKMDVALVADFGDITYGTNLNNNMSITATDTTLPAKTTTTVTITFSILDTSINAGLEGFVVPLTIQKAA